MPLVELEFIDRLPPPPDALSMPESDPPPGIAGGAGVDAQPGSADWLGSEGADG